jgi:hypothetical protein
LTWKLWTENPQTGRVGGIYQFENGEAAERYRRKHLARLAGFGITGIDTRSFEVNTALSRITRAPI